MGVDGSPTSSTTGDSFTGSGSGSGSGLKNIIVNYYKIKKKKI